MSLKKRCQEMFRSPVFLNNPRLMDKVKKEIDAVRVELIREDRVIWMLKIFKYFQYTNNESDLNKKEIKWCANFEKSGILHNQGELDILLKEGFTSPVGSDHYFFGHLRTEMKHYIELNINEINNIVLVNQSYDEIVGAMSNIENEWINSSQFKSRSLEESGTLIIQMPDGSAWFRLDKSSCRDEGDAMRHCGNGHGHGNEDHNIYSYRSPDPDSQGHWIPHVTVVMNNKEEGNLGEIKGYANSKPSKEYHEALIAFVMHDDVTSLDGGGYMPENNFSISDLTKEQQLDIYSKKPSLFDAFPAWILNNKVVDEQLHLLLKKDLGEHYNESVCGEEPSLTIMSGEDIFDFAEKLELPELYKKISWVYNLHSQSFCNALGTCQKKIEQDLDNLIKSPGNKSEFNDLFDYILKKYGSLMLEQHKDMSSGRDLALFQIVFEDPALSAIFMKGIRAGHAVDEKKSIEDGFQEVVHSLESRLVGSKFIQASPASDWKLVMPVGPALQLKSDIIDRYCDPGSIDVLSMKQISLYASDFLPDYIGERIKDIDTSKDDAVPWNGVAASEAMLTELRHQLKIIKELEIRKEGPFHVNNKESMISKLSTKNHTDNILAIN